MVYCRQGGACMKNLFPVMMDRPEKGASFAVYIWIFFCFVCTPTWIFTFMTGFLDDPWAMSWCEIIFNVINVFVIGFLYKNYFRESVFDAQINWRENARIVAICAVIILGLYFAVHQILSYFAPEELIWAMEGMLPVASSDTYVLASSVVYCNPLFGTLCMVLVAPFITCGFYYASTFAPVCCNYPWLAYPVTAVVLAIPRIAHANLYWNAADEAILYFAQLPIHMLACWSYQKTDNVWTPIALHMVINLAGSLLILITGYVL